MHILVTGANGFIGRALCSRLRSEEIEHVCAVRRPLNVENSVVIGEINSDTNWKNVLVDIDVVIHAAARAHIKRDSAADSMAEYRRVNVEGTLNLARQAAETGVRRFVFISSIGVNGNSSTCPFTENDLPNPASLYAQSKWEAEQGLQQLAADTNMEVVIIRPPLVYGPSAPGNFGSLIRIVEKGIPLPLGAIHNQRTLVALDNLVDLIIRCIDHPAAANQVFLAGDGEDLSTTELLWRLGKAMGRSVRLLPVPESLLVLGATLLGKQAVARRLLGSLQVDISKARDLLGWEPPLSVDEGLRRCFSS